MKDVTFVWKRTEYRVEAREVLPLIAKVEEIVTLGELIDESQSGKIRLARLAKAYGEALRYAGATLTDDEVYEGMFASKDRTVIVLAMRTLTALMFPMIPPDHLQEDVKSDGKKKATGAEGDTSKKHSRRV